MIILKEGDENLLYFFAGEIFLLDYVDEKVNKLNFTEFIRFIDTIPDEAVEWKKQMILRGAELVGMLKEVA